LKAADSEGRRFRWPHVRLGAVTVSGGYSYFSGGGWGYPYWAGGFFPYYSPWYYSPFFAPGYFTNFSAVPGYGELKLKFVPKESVVFLDGAYAGPAGKLKSMWLEPGVYELAVQNGSQTLSQKVYVLSGKTLSVSPDTLAQIHSGQIHP
jgi:hypothetical protein